MLPIGEIVKTVVQEDKLAVVVSGPIVAGTLLGWIGYSLIPEEVYHGNKVHGASLLGFVVFCTPVIMLSALFFSGNRSRGGLAYVARYVDMWIVFWCLCAYNLNMMTIMPFWETANRFRKGDANSGFNTIVAGTFFTVLGLIGLQYTIVQRRASLKDGGAVSYAAPAQQNKADFSTGAAAPATTTTAAYGGAATYTSGYQGTSSYESL